MYAEQKLDILMEEVRGINNKIDRIEQQIGQLRLILDQPQNEDGLRAKFSEFKENWNSESPEAQALKDNLLKLKSSLSGLASVLGDAKDIVTQQPAKEG